MHPGRTNRISIFKEWEEDNESVKDTKERR